MRGLRGEGRVSYSIYSGCERVKGGQGRVSYSIYSGCERVKGGRGGSVIVSTRGVRGLRGEGRVSFSILTWLHSSNQSDYRIAGLCRPTQP